MLNATFFIEQQVGHRTFYKNLRKFIDSDTAIAPNWVEITYKDEKNFWQKLPFIPENMSGSLVGRSQVRRGLRHCQADIYFFNTQVPAVFVSRQIQHKKYVLCTDITPVQYDTMSAHYDHTPDRNPLLQKYKFMVNKQVFTRAAKIIPWSHWVKESLIEDYGVASENIVVIPPGVDLNLWRPSPREESDNEKLRIIFVGGDFYRKGGEHLLQAFQRLPGGSAELVLVTRTTVAGAEDVFVYNNMRPNSPELIQLCQSCDVFVLPTQAEAFGIAAIEASAMGLPVLATEVGGLKDVVVDDETGYLFQPGDYEKLGELLQRLSIDQVLRKRLGQNGRKRAEAFFDARANTGKIAAVLREAAGQGV